jgi:hypothetical protein
MAKVDLKKQLKPLYAPSAKAPVLVDVPKMSFLMVDGAGDPNTAPEFQETCNALYGVAYTLKFSLKKQGGADFAVMPLEGLWWGEGLRDFLTSDKSDWNWTLMIALPDFLTVEQVRAAAEQLKKKKDSPAIGKVRFEAFHEGPAVQILHIGPYAAEGPTVERLVQFATEKGYELAGKHHEIYLGDPRRCAPEKLKTILRQPVRPLQR